MCEVQHLEFLIWRKFHAIKPSELYPLFRNTAMPPYVNPTVFINVRLQSCNQSEIAAVEGIKDIVYYSIPKCIMMR